jgi:hypothetical protein
MRKSEIEAIKLEDINESLIEQAQLEVPAWVEPTKEILPVDATQEEIDIYDSNFYYNRNKAHGEYLESLDKFNSTVSTLFTNYISQLELERQREISERWLSLNDQTYILHKMGIVIPNHFDKLKEVLDNDDLEFLGEFEVAAAQNTLEQQKQLQVSEVIALGAKSDGACKSVLNYIKGYNQKNNFTLAQINDMRTTFSDINECLKEGMPKTAKGLKEF